MTLQCNVVSHWLSPYPKWSLPLPDSQGQVNCQSGQRISAKLSSKFYSTEHKYVYLSNFKMLHCSKQLAFFTSLFLKNIKFSTMSHLSWTPCTRLMVWTIILLNIDSGKWLFASWHRANPWTMQTYRKTSSISHAKSQSLNVSCILLQLSSLNPVKPGVKLRMKM